MPAGRPRNPNTLPAAERNRQRRGALAVRAIELPGSVVDQLDALASAAGDASRAACVARLVREAITRLA